MQIKTFNGISSQEILAQIKAEMGPEAIILSSRDFRKDGQRWHEVTAGVDRPASVLDNMRRPATAQAVAFSGAIGESSNSGPGAGLGAGMGSSTNSEWTEWKQDWMLIREHMYALMQPSIQWERLSPRQRVALEFMRREGVEGWVIMELYQRLAASPGASVLEALSNVTQVRPWRLEEWPERVHIMAGPFGGGKTISALRMALLLRQEAPDLKIAFINADCERGNGRLVLRHWAELSGFTYLEAAGSEDMRNAMRAAGTADTIFVDLPGISRDGSLAYNLSEMGLMNLGAAVHLAMPPHYGAAQNQAFIDRYQTNLTGSLVWTKLDESAGCGPLINLSALCGLPVSALSYGPGLRGTLCPATEPLLWRLVFKHQLPGQGTPSPASMSGGL